MKAILYRVLPEYGRRLDSLKPGGLGILAFLAGSGAVVTLNIVGEISVAELLLPVAGLFALTTAGGRTLFKSGTFRALFAGLLVTFLGYWFSDVYRGTPDAQAIRAYGRILILATSFVSLALLGAADRRNIWWFAAGYGGVGVLYLRLVHHMPLPLWKFGYADYMSVGFAAAACLFPRRIAALGFAFLAILSIKYDFRIQSAILFLVGTLVWQRGATVGAPKRRNPKLLPALVAVAVAGVAVFVATRVTEDDYSKMRREGSNLGRTIGVESGWRAFLESPVVGYGSWGISAELAAVQQRVGSEEYARIGRPGEYVPTGSPLEAHSQILQAGLEGGILGAVFFIVFGYLLISRLKLFLLSRPFDALTPLFCYFWIYPLWHLVQSPFAAPQRMGIALGAATLAIFSLEVRAAYQRYRQHGTAQMRAAAERSFEAVHGKLSTR